MLRWVPLRFTQPTISNFASSMHAMLDSYKIICFIIQDQFIRCRVLIYFPAGQKTYPHSSLQEVTYEQVVRDEKFVGVIQRIPILYRIIDVS